MAGAGGSNCNTFAKTICSICYEDLKPIVEDLQSISICGHVFHELCLQQWFEYCENAKKKSCPVCKQNCAKATVSRLYFQSIGESNDQSLSQKVGDYEGYPEELRAEIKRLEGKVLSLGSALELQQKEFKDVNEELLTCKEQLKLEVSLKSEAISQKLSMQQLLHSKSQGMDRLTLENMRLQERNMGLAKELAALKLASDLNLQEDEILKLASLGNDSNSKETVDVLRRSLIIRNKSYKELMTKCTNLGRGEARSLHKLEKAKEKIKKLKVRVQELEIAVEAKENEVLRSLKASKKAIAQGGTVNDFVQDLKPSENSHNAEMEKPSSHSNLDKISYLPSNSFCSRGLGLSRPPNSQSRLNLVDGMFPRSACDLNNTEKGSLLIIEDDDMVDSSTRVHESSSRKLMPPIDDEVVVQITHQSKRDLTSDAEREAQGRGQGKEDDYSLPGSSSKSNQGNPATLDDDVICYGGTTVIQPLLNIRKETASSVPVAQPGDPCFSGGLLGPDGTSWHLGKWCKKSERKPGLQKANAGSGNLIAVGADGRGGRIKVLRTLDQSSLDKANTPLAKKCKLGAKTSSLQSQGHLQIEHFFRKTGQ